MPSYSRVGLGCALLFTAGGLQAQVREPYEFPDPARRAPYQLGDSPIFVRPYVGAGVGRDDNVLLAPDNERSSNYWNLSPGFVADARRENMVVALKYEAQIGRYADSREDDYEDQSARAGLDWAIDRRNYLRIGLDYVRAHDRRGLTDRPVSDTPDKFRETLPNVRYTFGSPGARGRVEVYASEAYRRYLNNRENTESSDRDVREYGGAFYWRFAPKTYAIAELRQTDISYLRPSPADGTERRYYGGVTWQATAATSGTLKVGRMERSFDSGIDDSSSSWEARVTWAPRSYSVFEFATFRQTNEATGVGLYILSSVAAATWTHAWSSTFSTGADVRFQKDRFRGTDRRDDIRSIGLRAGYKFRRWLTLGAEYSYSERDSTTPTSDFDRNFYLLTATASM